MNENNNTIKSSEEIFEKVLKLWEDGKSRQQILDIFPEYQEHVKEFFEVIDVLENGKSKVLPRKDVLSGILSQISTEAPVEEETKVQPPIFSFKWGGLFSLFTKRMYLATGIATIIVVAIMGGFWHFKRPIIAPKSEIFYETTELLEKTSEPEALNQGVEPEITPPEARQTEQEPPEAGAVQKSSPAQAEPPEETPDEPEVDLSDLEEMEDELIAELEGFLSDLNDLEEFGSDTSLDGLDGGLGDIIE